MIYLTLIIKLKICKYLMTFLIVLNNKKKFIYLDFYKNFKFKKKNYYKI